MSLLRTFLCLSAVFVAETASAQELEIVNIRVGQGDATLIQGPIRADGSRVNVLFDGGDVSAYDGGKVIGAVLARRGVKVLDYLVVSHYDVDHIYALGLASKPTPTLATIGNYRLVWMRGYEYNNYLPNIRRFNEIHRSVGILPMLIHERADFYIDASMEIEEVLAKADDPKQFKLSPLINLPLYLGFANNENGRTLRALFDRRMEVLAKSGELKPIFERWKQPYPFDEHGKPPKP